MANFNKAFTKVIKAEGGYVNDPNDKGGETYLGVSRRANPKSEIWKYIDEIKKANPAAKTNKELTTILKKDNRIEPIVKALYKNDYWDKVRGDEIISQKVAEQLFDMAVNAGVLRAIRLMSDVVNSWPTSIATDNFIKAVNNYAKRHNPYL